MIRKPKKRFGFSHMIGIQCCQESWGHPFITLVSTEQPKEGQDWKMYNHVIT